MKYAQFAAWTCAVALAVFFAIGLVSLGLLACWAYRQAMDKSECRREGRQIIVNTDTGEWRCSSAPAERP